MIYIRQSRTASSLRRTVFRVALEPPSRCRRPGYDARVPCQEGASQGKDWDSPGEAPHFAMRNREGKTVMAEKESQSPEWHDQGRTPASTAGRQTLDQLFSVTYEELRRLASSVRRGDPSATLSPTALVNEAWLKLAKSPDVAATSRLPFKRIAAPAPPPPLFGAPP